MFVQRGRLGRQPFAPRRRPLRGLHELVTAALRATACRRPVTDVAGLICEAGGQIVAGGEFSVWRARPGEAPQCVAGPPVGPELLESADSWLTFSHLATEAPQPVTLPGPSFGWVRVGPIAGGCEVLLLARLPAPRPLRARERRLFEKAIHLAQVAFSHAAMFERLETTNQQFEVALDRISQGVCFFDGQSRLLLANPRYAEIYGIDPSLIRPGMTLLDITELRRAAGSSPEMSTEQYLDWRKRVNSESGAMRTIMQLANGKVVEIYNQPMPDGGWVATHEDITARTGAEAQIAHMARHDALTGLSNRLLFRERLEAALAVASPTQLCAVLCLDLDGFKPVNDSFGHPVGDALLQAVAGRLRRCTREHDTVSRLGGDEFAILTQFAHVSDAADLAVRIADSLGDAFQIGEISVRVGVSVGIAVSQGEVESADELVKRADLALYRAKAEARGAHRWYEPSMQDQLTGRLQLEQELRDGMAAGQFELFYQPLFDLARGEVCAFEALLRWHHPRRGLVSPGEFIPLAEKSGLIVPLGDWVIARACADAARWPDHITVAVNLSAAQFRGRALAGTVQEALRASGLPARRLELEVTETVLLENDATTLQTLQTLSAVGVRLSMDDFGTGHSSLNYLRRFPFNKLKIDQSYIRDMANRPDSLAIVRAMLNLGRSLNLVTTAEGVETEAQLSRLREEGCDEVQGFLFSQPRPACEVPAMLCPAALSPSRSVTSPIPAAA